MPDYSKGQIYTIRCRTDDTKIYVGSTIQPLYKRFHTHKNMSNTEKCMNILLYKEVDGDWDDWYIELYEKCPCNDRNELEKKEGEVIRLIGTLNRYIAGRDKKEYYIDNADIIKEYKKQYRIDNADKIKEKDKQYRIENADIIKENKKQYRIDNADKIKVKNKQYRVENAEKLKEYEKNRKNSDERKQYQQQYRLKKKNEKEAQKLKELSEATS